MSRQNRVDPEGRLIAIAARGSLMGNRGCLHDDRGNVIRMSARDAWVTCLLDFKGRQRTVMQPGHYTELFFLDEATALAAGHRPCAECRRDRYGAYLDAWMRAFGLTKRPTAKEVDAELKRGRGRLVPLVQPDIAALPAGTCLKDTATGEFFVVAAGGLVRWSFAGYLACNPASVASGRLAIVTPACHVAVLRAGYVPELHPSAGLGTQ
jgi:hypothetical protein